MCGTINSYTTYKCRCEPCREAKSAYSKSYKTKGLSKGDTRHGSENGFKNYGCRCELCANASRISAVAAKLGITREQVSAMRQISECELCGTEFKD